MAGAGSKVMQSRAVEFAKKFGVEFEVRSSFKSDAGTIAKEETANMEDVVIRGISLERNQAKVTVDDVRDEPGIAGRSETPRAKSRSSSAAFVRSSV